jgi:hypothetical protein
MIDTIKVYGEKTKEHQRLEAAALIINAEFDSKFAEAIVEDTYFDYGGGVKWTTIIIGDYQALDPMQQAKIVLGDMKDFGEAVTEVIKRHRQHVQLVNAVRYGVE